MASANVPSYGAVSGNEEVDFDPRYLEERALTRQEKVRRFVTIILPILVAGCIVGGFAWFLTHDFGRLYPRPGTGGSGSPSYPNDAPVPIRHDYYYGPPPGIIAPAPAPAPKTKIETPAVIAPTKNSEPEKSKKSCDNNEKCKSLDLRGDCCPTTAGVMLQCCS